MENQNAGTTGIAAVEAPRKLAGLVAGRIVNYVMKNGEIRPLLIVQPWDATGVVNGVLFFDGSNDNDNHHVPLLPDRYGHVAECTRWITSAHYDDLGIEPGTWHWPPRASVVASAVDPATLAIQVDALINPLIDHINAKLDAHLASVAEMTQSPTVFLNSGAGYSNGVGAGVGPANTVSAGEDSGNGAGSTGGMQQAVDAGKVAEVGGIEVEKESVASSTAPDLNEGQNEGPGSTEPEKSEQQGESAGNAQAGS